MRSLTLLGVRTLGKTEEGSWCLSWLLDTRVSVRVHVPSCAGVGFRDFKKYSLWAVDETHIN